MERKQSELTVITKTKDLCSYVMTVTQKSPKQFRFTFVTRLQNLALSAIENLFRANDVFVSKSDAMAENFFSILKTECIYRTKLKTYEEARLLIGEYIHFYNHERIQIKTKLTPLEKRSQYVA